MKEQNDELLVRGKCFKNHKCQILHSLIILVILGFLGAFLFLQYTNTKNLEKQIVEMNKTIQTLKTDLIKSKSKEVVAKKYDKTKDPYAEIALVKQDFTMLSISFSENL